MNYKALKKYETESQKPHIYICCLNVNVSHSQNCFTISFGNVLALTVAYMFWANIRSLRIQYGRTIMMPGWLKPDEGVGTMSEIVFPTRSPLHWVIPYTINQ